MKRKLIASGILFFLLTLINIWFANFVHLVLSKQFTDFSNIKYMNCVKEILNNPQLGKVFLVLELLIFTLIMILAVTYNSDAIKHTSKMYKVTEYIEVPMPAGQNQYGSAWWLSEKEKNIVFDTVELKGPDIERLIECGYDDLDFIKRI